jgi:recombination protein RecR
VARSRAVERLIECLGRLPGVGIKTSERLAFHLLRVPEAEALDLAAAIQDARARVRVCARCFNLDEADPCSICADAQRDHALVLVVEDPRDLRAFEEAGFRGVYHVLQGRVSSLDGIGPGDLTIDALVRRVRAGGVREVCLATNPDLEGEGTARVLAEQLAAAGANVTRIARGIPAGATIAQVSKSILADAVEGRRSL